MKTLDFGLVYGTSRCRGEHKSRNDHFSIQHLWLHKHRRPKFDGINDEFGVYGTDIISIEFSIFDRWGALLFTTTDQNEFWDGKFDGKSVSQGAYVWQLKLQGYKRDGSILSDVLSGSVTLVY